MGEKMNVEARVEATRFCCCCSRSSPESRKL